MTIDERSRSLWKRVSPAQRIAFFSCFLTGYLIHLFAFTNYIPNSDGLSRIFDPQQMTIAGRWFLHYTTAPNDYTQMPAAIALISMLFLGLAAALVVDLLRVRSSLLAGLAGAVMSAFPSMGFTFLYMFTAAAYCIAIFLAVWSVWLAKKGRFWTILAVVALAFSMGAYQAYVTVSIGLAMLLVLREIMDPDATFRGTLNLGLRMMAYLALSAILYYAILLFFLHVKDLRLWSYLGMDSASSGYPFDQLPNLIFASYKEVVTFFFLAGSADSFATPWLVVLNLIALVLGAAMLINRFIAKDLWHELWRPLTTLVLLLLLPLGMNFGQILSPHSAPTPLMKYSFVIVYLLIILVADLNDELLAAHSLVPVTTIWAALLLLCFLNTNNLLYTISNQAHRATESYITRMVARIEDCPNYEPGMEVAIIGTIPKEQLQAQIENYTKIDHYSIPLNHVVPLNKHIYYYIHDWLNIPIYKPAEEVMISISRSKAFQDMPLYPEQGSVQVLDGRVVVKLQPTYKPMSQFEIDYESRY